MTATVSRWVIASGNQGKIKEFQALFSDWSIDVVSQTTLNISSAEETGLSFVENAILKARHAALISGMPAIADDSGLSVDYLNGAPGIYSARYSSDQFGEAVSDERNNQKLLAALESVPEEKRTAQFICALAFVRHGEDPVPVLSLGIWKGLILTEPRGDQGFGYDPLFYLPEYQCSSAELSREHKNRVSHRAQAMAKLQLALQDENIIS
jgi:XTP/dITP diphosphohydrolase